MRRTYGVALSVLAMLAGARAVSAAVTLPEIIGDGMVLQRGKPAAIWGTADAGEKVSVQFAGQQKITVADKQGKWRVMLDAMPANNVGAVMQITGENAIALKDVLVGEVWICSGQSNMDWTLFGTAGGPEAVEKANDPQMRLFLIPQKFRKAGDMLEARWQSTTPESTKGFSAVAYYFGRDLRGALKVPVGLIHSSWGGTQAESWTPREYLASDPDLKPCLDREKIWDAERTKAQAEFDARTAEWKKLAEQAKAEGKKVPNAPKPPDALRHDRPAGTMYRVMLEPIMGYGARGVLWYQGESNEGRAWQYRKLLPTMIQSWRDRFAQPDLWFGIIQLPGFRQPANEPTDTAWAHLRDAQLATAKSVKNSGLIVTIDVGERNNIHPERKEPVGQRACQWALADVYGKSVTRGGPLFVSAAPRGSEMVVKFADVGEGLKAKDGGELKEFWIAGQDRKWVFAQARIEGKDTIVVRADGVTEPQAVRYAWNSYPREPNLTNQTGIPASPFRTDDWAGPTDAAR